MFLEGLFGVALLGLDVFKKLLAVAAGRLGGLGGEVETAPHQLGEARPRRIERLSAAALQVLQQFAQLRHALNRLRLVVVAQRFEQILVQLLRPAGMRVRKLPLNCGSSSSIFAWTSSMSARVGRCGGGAVSITAVSVRSRPPAWRTRTRTSMLCFTSMANSTSTGEPTGRFGSRSETTICLTTRFSSKIGTTMRPAWSWVRQVQLKDARQRRPRWARPLA